MFASCKPIGHFQWATQCLTVIKQTQRLFPGKHSQALIAPLIFLVANKNRNKTEVQRKMEAWSDEKSLNRESLELNVSTRGLVFARAATCFLTACSCTLCSLSPNLKSGGGEEQACVQRKDRKERREGGGIVDWDVGVTNGGWVFCSKGRHSLFNDFSLLAGKGYSMLRKKHKTPITCNYTSKRKKPARLISNETELFLVLH